MEEGIIITKTILIKIFREWNIDYLENSVPYEINDSKELAIEQAEEMIKRLKKINEQNNESKINNDANR